MKFLYTTKPDKYCHDFGEGVHGRPVHTSKIKEMLDKGWVRDAKQLTKESGSSKAETKEATKEKGLLGRDELAKSLDIKLTDDEGKKLHYKLIDGLIEKAQANEHNEGQASK